MSSILRNYFSKKSKLSIAIDILIAIMILFLIIPATRKDTAAFILKPTLIIHQPKLLKERNPIQEEAFQWKLMKLDGSQHSFSEFQGKVIFINLWATWCPPCIAEMPQLQKLYETYGDSIAFLFITNEDIQVVETFMQSKKITLPVYIPISQYPSNFETRSLPTTFIVSKKGELVLAKHGVAQWNTKKIKKILNSLIEE